MSHPVKLETLKLLAEGVAEEYGVSLEQATQMLIHEHGHENVDFSGGRKSDVSDDTEIIEHLKSVARFYATNPR
ncbi:MAG: hypothetical protein WC217_02695 [Candidatus Paceibacterota bacterium]|jgi:hypothetical protein